MRRFRPTATPSGRSSLGGIVPHAGWRFSGEIAAQVIGALTPEAETVVVVGGHLGRSEGALAASEEAYDTPLGPIAADLELLGHLQSEHTLQADDRPDNTVEVQLPLIRCLLPSARVLALRAPPRPEARALGATIARAAAKLGRRVAVLGSTDLTHYGPGYGFAPRGTGPDAVEWVRTSNDARIVRAMLALDSEASLAAAREDRSACSIGGALAAMGFARAQGVTTGRLLSYATSMDALPVGSRGEDSFVGYAGIVYP